MCFVRSNSKCPEMKIVDLAAFNIVKPAIEFQIQSTTAREGKRIVEASFRPGCGGGNINSAERSNEEICGTNWFPFLL